MFAKIKQDVCIRNSETVVNFMFMDNQNDKTAKKAVKQAAFNRMLSVLDDKGISYPRFQEQLGIQSQHWTNWSNRGLPDGEIFRIANLLGLNADWLATETGPKYKSSGYISDPIPTIYANRPIESNAAPLGGFDLWDDDTPLHADEVALNFFREVELAAGGGRTHVIENHGRKLRFSKATLKRHGIQADHAACVTVSGNSMEPVLPDGCTIGIDTGNTEIKNGELYAIDHDGHLRVKMLYKMPGEVIRLRSYNSDEWPDEHYSADAAAKIRIIGRVFWWSVLR